jgi:myo-inositol-1-phosphate synthase
MVDVPAPPDPGPPPPPSPATGLTGVWLVGARGSVATATVCGAAALAGGLVEPVGCVTERPDFAGAGLPAYGDLVFGGHDVVGTPLEKRAELLAEGGVLPHRLVPQVRAELRAADAEVRPGYEPAAGGPQAAAAERLVADLTGFRERHGLARVVVVDVASTEPPCPDPGIAAADLPGALAAGAPLPPSALYAWAAFTAGCSFVEFTPSVGPRLPALAELALSIGVPWAGADGKTGETLVKTALAPMFAARALRVRSWAGVNLLGGGDGANLADPEVARSKLASKARGVSSVLGHPVPGPLHIDHVPDLGEWKTAWDHVSFEGFLGARMTLQFTWAGCDSALAAPLVLDLARLVGRAHQSGRSGPLAPLGFFFKDPVGARGHSLEAQYDALRDWAAAL